jgi:prepilin-type N-terminal cleavage/methylation domain-containing protein
MKSIRLHRGGAFTLIELLIVVTILGIIAAIVIPRFSSAAEQSRINAMRAELQQLRNTISLYREEHGGQLPNLLPDWGDLTGPTTYNGRTYGPYLQQTPRNIFNNVSTVVDGIPGTPAASPGGFIYDYNSGNGTGKIGATEKDGTTPFSG